MIKRTASLESKVMKKQTLIRFFAVLILAAMNMSVYAELPQNRDAVTWYNQALKAQTDAEKITGYENAIKADPDFGQAHFQLALVYKQQKEFENAKKHLQLALTINKGKDARKIHFNAAFELARLFKSLKNYQEAANYYLKAKENVPSKKFESTLLFELATCYFRLEQFDKAYAEAQSGMKNSSDNRIYFQNFLQALDKAREIAENYATAVRIIKEDSLLEAKMLLSNIEKQSPGYKNTQELLNQLNISINKKETGEILTSLYEKGIDFEKNNKSELAIATFEQILEKDKNFKDTAVRLNNLENQIAEKNKVNLLKLSYNEGIAAIESGEWTQAIIAFERVLKNDAKYLDTSKKLQLAKQGLNQENQSTIIQQFYENGRQAIFARNWGTALIALEKVKNIDHKYKDVQRLLAQVEMRISSPSERNNSTIDLKTASLLDSLYTDAQGFIQLQDWFQSVALLEKIQIIKPGYRDVIDLLATSRTNLALSNNDLQNSFASQKSEESSLFLSGLLISLLFLPLVGAVVFVPQARAKAFTLIGKHHLAADIYERLLQQNPGKLKLYSPLANAYLLNGRQDQRALELFNTILKLNLNIPNRKKLEQIVQKKYLKKGSRSSDAIEAFNTASRSASAHSQ